MSWEILSNEQMAAADRITIESGTAGAVLMQNAAQAAVDIIQERYSPQKVKILCGPGNNGGDGFVIAKILKKLKWDVSVYGLVSKKQLKGDALNAASAYDDKVYEFSDLKISEDDLIIDAVFGTGFSGEFKEPASEIFEALSEISPDVIAIDIPSGVNGSTGAACRFAVNACLTITFCRKKFGHVLLPGKQHSHEVIVCDIAIPDEAVMEAGFDAFENNPEIFESYLGGKEMGGHKYSAGHAVVFGGAVMTGAALMAADAALHMGAGLCTIAGNASSADVYRSYKPNIMYEPIAHFEDFPAHLEDERRNVFLIGPGAGLDEPEDLKRAVLESLARAQDRQCILDADALSVFSDNPVQLFKALGPNCVLTPHEGEFKKLFPDLKGDKFSRARAACDESGAVIVLKGSDTVICAPDEKYSVINNNAPPALATAGSGDVLAGMILGLMARGIPAYMAACAGVFLHGECGNHYGIGLTAPDIINKIPEVLREFS
jgi:NAD(P)H-hydrate epimerase